MKTSMKKWIAGVTMATVLGFSVAPAYAAVEVGSTDLTLVVNGKTVTTNEEIGQPFITKDGHTMIPLRLVNSELGYDTDWEEDGSIHITSADGKVDVLLIVGADSYLANGKPGVFSARPTLLNDRTYLPVRDFMELYGVVKWDNDTRTVTITTGEQPAKETSDWTYQLSFGGDIGTVMKMYVTATNEKTGKVVYLTGLDKVFGDWVNQSEHYTDYYLNDTKTINGQDTVTVGRQGVAGGCEVALFLVPDLDKVDKTAELTYVRSINNSTDYTIANGYLYYTQGIKGPWVNDPNALYFTKVSDATSNVITFDLDFAVNACVLTVEDGVLVATEKDGTRHEILNVPEADSVDVAHMKEILEAGTTLEGFLETGFLTAAEISCLPGAVTSSEFGSLQ